MCVEIMEAAFGKRIIVKTFMSKSDKKPELGRSG
jgi:hypothetical protein